MSEELKESNIMSPEDLKNNLKVWRNLVSDPEREFKEWTTKTIKAMSEYINKLNKRINILEEKLKGSVGIVTETPIGYTCKNKKSKKR